MKSNSLITYVIYALLLGLIMVAGYKACQIRQEQSQRQKENAELDQVMRDLGYSNDSTTSGSTYVDSSESRVQQASPIVKIPTSVKPSAGETTQPKVSATGIEDEPSAPQSTPATKTTTVKPTTTTTAKSPSLSGKTPNYGGRFMVITGAFKDVGNARDEMETLVKAGYQNAEVKKFTSAWAHVIALRTNDRAAADRAVEKLKSEGYSGAYVKKQ